MTTRQPPSSGTSHSCINLVGIIGIGLLVSLQYFRITGQVVGLLSSLKVINNASNRTESTKSWGEEKLAINLSSLPESNVSSIPDKEPPARSCTIKKIPIVRNWIKPRPTGTQTSRYQKCLRFHCDNKNFARCDNMLPTNYEGPEPPCCVHVLRDMARAFDDIMCEIGLEYFSTYGMLLGLLRSDRLIPWTIDNDYIADRSTVQYLIDMNDTDLAIFDKHGLHFLQDNFFRVCPTANLAGGKLAAKFRRNHTGWYPLTFQYSDIFIADTDRTGQWMLDELNCYHNISDFRPIQRRPVYNGSFHVSFPNHPEPIIEAVYGKYWRTPDAKKSEHGNTKCPNKAQHISWWN